MSIDLREARIALNAAHHLSRAAICRLALELETWSTAHGSPARIEAARALGVPELQVELAATIVAEAARHAPRERAAVARAGGRLIVWGDPDYPERLSDLTLPPPALYCRGTLPAVAPTVAIVGARHADAYALEVAQWFAGELAGGGVAVVSGFARGVDGAAHRAAVEAGGRTVAVLGCGLAVDYPQRHAALRDAIAERGALVSEFPCDAPPSAWHFPVRNRIIAGLAQGVLVVAAAPRSGSLVTARLALELGREIFAVPGRLFDELALGPNALVRDGATLVQHPADVRTALGLDPTPQLVSAGASARSAELPRGPAGLLLAALARGERSGEALARESGLPIDQTLALLLELELGGQVARAPGPLYRLPR